MSNIDDVKNLYEGIAAEAYKMPDRVDPSDIRKAQRAKKVRNLATDGATEGERAAAERKTKGPKLMGEDTLDEKKKDCVKADKKTMHNCAKKVCSEQWGVVSASTDNMLSLMLT